MDWDVTQAGGHGSISDFEDSFLRKFVQSRPLPLLPFPGERLGGPEGQRYEVLEWMGGGGMGQVFRACDAMLRREVALKFLLPGPGLEAEALTEARAVARLDHENIVRIFDVTEWRGLPDEPGVPFLVMECLEGESLSALLKRGRLEARRALEVLDGIATGLAHAHERGLIHRDLKPGNVFLCRTGTVKLLDFGLSHRVAANAGTAPRQPRAGTPAYMAPEQWRGEPQDTRTDIWAAGVVLHEMLTGGLPFESASLTRLREQVTSDAPVPPVRMRNPEIPREVESLLATLLAKAPARRLPTARELQLEVRELRARLAGSRFEAVPGPPQRRQLVLLSCQLTGFSGLATRFDAEDVSELEGAFQRSCAAVIQRHGGTVHLYVEGEVFACFGSPQVREDDAERAVRAALQLAHTLPELLQWRLPHLSLSGLGVRVGLHTDQMVLDRHALRGPGPRVASWLAGEAGPGEVLASEATWKQVRGAFDTESLGPRDFVGLVGPGRVSIHRVRHEREGRVRFDRTLVAGGLTPLVGREHELRRLQELWEGAKHGRGAFVLLRGEAGIGKSRLLQELREGLSSEPVLDLRFQCWSRPDASALPPVAEVAHRLLSFSPGGTPQRHLEELETKLGALDLSLEHVHALGVFLSLPVPESSPVHRSTPERRMERTYEALVDLLSGVAGARPVLFAVEDVHWADSTWRGLLDHMFECVEGTRTLVVLSARPEFHPAWHSRAAFHLLPLERLAPGLAANLVRGVAGARELPEETVRELVERTDGIPLFIEELTRRVLEGEEVASVPVTLHELLLARLDLLPSRQKSLAQLAAVVGRSFSQALLAALAGRDISELWHELAGLVEAGLLQEEAAPDGPGYQFRHALFQETVYQSLSRGERRWHHQQAAHVLEERFPLVGETRPELLAHHYTEAGVPARAIPYWSRAGQLSLQRMAIPEVVSHLTRALELLRRLPQTSASRTEELRMLAVLGFAQALMKGFDSREAARTHARIQELLREIGDLPSELTESIWNIFAFDQLRGEFLLCHELAEQLLRQGERQHSPELLASGHGMMAIACTYRGHVRCALENGEHALACARSCFGPRREPSLAESLAYLSVIRSVVGRLEEAREAAREAAALALRVGGRMYVAEVLTYVEVGCMVRRDVQDAARRADEVIALASERSHWVWPTWSRAIQGWALAEKGRPLEGLELMRQQARHWKSHGIRGGLTCCAILMTEAQLKLGQLREGVTTVDEALREARATGERGFEAELRRLRGELLRAQGLEREARSDFLRAIAVAREQGALLFELRATVGLGRLLRDTGRPNLARRLVRRALASFPMDVDSADVSEARALLD